jgi:hypothetical protein
VRMKAFEMALGMALLAGAAIAEQPPRPIPKPPVPSQEPSPGSGVSESRPPKSEGKSAGEVTDNDQRSTENAPLFVKVVPPEKSQEEAARDRAEAQEKTALDRQVAEYTGFTALFTCFLFVVGSIQAGLFLWQLKLFRRSLADTRAAADAAKLGAEAAKKSADTAERSLTELEAPILFVKVVQTGIVVDLIEADLGQKNVLKGGRLKYRLVNCGRTPALLLNAADEISVLRKGAGFPPPIDPESRREYMGRGYYVPPGSESDDFDINLFGRWFAEPIENSDAILNEVFLNVFIRYVDIFSNSNVYVAGFLFMLDKAFDKFVLTSAGDAFNYRRKEGNSEKSEAESELPR